MENVQLIIKIVIGCIVMILGGSFAYKCFRATVQGKMTYWSGFLPLSVLSPFLVHSRAKEGTLLKETAGLWVHLVMGPIFFVAAVLCFAFGADLASLPGTNTLNLILAGGNPTAPAAVVYNKNYGFSFPIFSRVSHKFQKSVNTVIIPLSEKDRPLGYHEGEQQH